MIDAQHRNTALLVAGCFFMEMLDGTIVTTASPQIGRSLHAPPGQTGLLVTAYLLTLADNAQNAYFVTGPILTQYTALGGPGGALGYPLANATAGARQNFQNGALAGNPVQTVSGAIPPPFSSPWAPPSNSDRHQASVQSPSTRSIPTSSRPS